MNETATLGLTPDDDLYEFDKDTVGDPITPYLPRGVEVQCPECGRNFSLFIMVKDESLPARTRIQMALRQTRGGLSVTRIRALTGMGNPRIQKTLDRFPEFVSSGNGTRADPRTWRMLTPEQVRARRGES